MSSEQRKDGRLTRMLKQRGIFYTGTEIHGGSKTALVVSHGWKAPKPIGQMARLMDLSKCGRNFLPSGTPF